MLGPDRIDVRLHPPLAGSQRLLKPPHVVAGSLVLVDGQLERPDRIR